MAYTFGNITVDSSTLKWGKILQGYTQFSCNVTGSSSNDIVSEIADNTSFNNASWVSGYTRTGTTVTGTITTLNNNNTVYWRLTDNYTHTPNYVTVPAFHEVRPGSNTYSGRTNASGQSSAEGKFAFLHLTWDVDWTADGNTIDTVSCTATVDGTTTTLTPFKGSIAEGYIDYITDLPLNKTATFYASLKDSALSTVKQYRYEVGVASIAFSLFDDHSVTGAAFGRQSAKEGVWVYNDFYIKGANDKMWKVKIDASGNITTEDATYYDFIWNKTLYPNWANNIKTVDIQDTRIGDDIEVSWEMNNNNYRACQLYYVNTNGNAVYPSEATGCEWPGIPIGATSQGVPLGEGIFSSFRRNGSTLEMVVGVEDAYTYTWVKTFVNGVATTTYHQGVDNMTVSNGGTISFNTGNSYIMRTPKTNAKNGSNQTMPLTITVTPASGYSFQKAVIEYSAGFKPVADVTTTSNPFTAQVRRGDTSDYSGNWGVVNIYLTN